MSWDEREEEREEERGEERGGDEPLTLAERQFLLDSGMPADSFDPARQMAARESLRRRAEETRRNASPELTTWEVAGLLGCTADQILAWARSQDVYSIDTPAGLRFPEWQFPDGQRLADLRLVLGELGPDIHPYSVEGLLAEVAHEELDDMTAVEWLAGGGSVGAVVDLARFSNYDS